MERSAGASSGAGSLAVALATTTTFSELCEGGWHAAIRRDPKRDAGTATAMISQRRARACPMRFRR
jgi:hypothetical protein